jgi:hypothetical protein
MDKVQRASDTTEQGQQALTTGQQMLDAGRTATDEARNWWQRNQVQPPHLHPDPWAHAGSHATRT